MEFDAPLVLFLAPLVGGAVWFAAAWARRARLSRAARWSAEAAMAARAAGRFGPTAVSVAAFLGTVALAGPRWGEERIEAETRGLSLVMVVDISRSMLAEDAGGASRLARALREARRLTQDLDGDRLGLVAFAGASYILSPLSSDGSALGLYLDALDPEVASEGGTALAPALRTGGELLNAGSMLADRVLVVFTDGEGHDSLGPSLQAAEALGQGGVHVILVGEGGQSAAHIPVRDDQGHLQGWQQDENGNVIETWRRDSVLNAVADAAQGTVVAAELPDQAGAIRDLVAAYKRSRSTEARVERGRPQAWVPLLGGLLILFAQALSRRTAALVGLLLAAALTGRPARAQTPYRRTSAEKAWDRGDTVVARRAYLAELVRRRTDDVAWFNAGAAALAAGDRETAQSALARAAASLDPEVRFRALFDQGWLALREAGADTVNRDAHLADAERAYREALLLKPHSLSAKWNLELAVRRKSGGGGGQSQQPPSNGGGGGARDQQGQSQGSEQQPRPQSGGLSQSQAEEVLRSIGQEELRTRRQQVGRTRRGAPPGVKDW